MKTTIDLPDDLLREVKLRAVLEGRTVKALVTDCLRQALGILPKNAVDDLADPSSLVQTGVNGLPVVRCAPDAPATLMSVEELLQLEQEAQAQEDRQSAGDTV